jgi:hypothetical protein
VEAVTVGLRVACPGLDAEGLAKLASNLLEAVSATDVDQARLGIGGPAPAGAKSGEVLAVGALVVTLAPTVLEGLIAVVSSWLSRQPSDVEVDIDGHRFRGRVTRSQRDELVVAYLRRLDTST